MRAIIRVCIVGSLVFTSLTVSGEETLEYASVPPVDDCHYAEHPIIRKTVHHKKYSRIKHHHVRVHHRQHFTNDLSVYFSFSAPSYYDNTWPSDDCHCEKNGYVIASLSSDELMYNIINYSPLYEAGNQAASCDFGAEE